MTIIIYVFAKVCGELEHSYQEIITKYKYDTPLADTSVIVGMGAIVFFEYELLRFMTWFLQMVIDSNKGLDLMDFLSDHRIYTVLLWLAYTLIFIRYIAGPSIINVLSDILNYKNMKDKTPVILRIAFYILYILVALNCWFFFIASVQETYLSNISILK